MELATLLKHLLTQYYELINLFIPTNDTTIHSSEGKSSGYTNAGSLQEVLRVFNKPVRDLGKKEIFLRLPVPSNPGHCQVPLFQRHLPTHSLAQPHLFIWQSAGNTCLSQKYLDSCLGRTIGWIKVQKWKWAKQRKIFCP